MWWPQQVISARMPQKVKEKFPDCTCYIDCTEVFIEQPSDKEKQVAAYSSYKSHHTLKVSTI